MQLAILGSGNVATHLGRAFLMAGHEIKAVWSRHGENAQRLSRMLNAQSVESLADMPPAEIYIISVSDDAIAEVSQQLRYIPADAIVVHTAGSVAMDVLQRERECYGVMYPMQTFLKNKGIDMSVVPFFVEGSNNETTEKIASLARSVSKRVRVLNSKERARLHLAAVFACNFVNHCFTIADKELQKCGEDISILLPLIEETISKIHLISPEEAQTGPAIRGDENVMRKQLELIDDEQIREVYRAMSNSIRQSTHL